MAILTSKLGVSVGVKLGLKVGDDVGKLEGSKVVGTSVGIELGLSCRFEPCLGTRGNQRWHIRVIFDKRASQPTLVASLFNNFIMGRDLSDDQLLALTAAEARKLTNVSRKCCAVCCLKRRRCRNKLNIISFIHFHFQQQADRRKALTLHGIDGVTGAEAERNALVAKITKDEMKAKNRQRMRKTRAEKRAEDKKKEKAEEASTQ